MRIITSLLLRILPDRRAGRHRAIPAHPVYGPLHPIGDTAPLVIIRHDGVISVRDGGVTIRHRGNGRLLPGTQPRRWPDHAAPSRARSDLADWLGIRNQYRRPA